MKATVDILDDLLLVEKMESGLMKLHKEDVEALKFIHEVVETFSAHARHCEVVLQVESEDDSRTGARALRDGDRVSVDKFKVRPRPSTPSCPYRSLTPFHSTPLLSSLSSLSLSPHSPLSLLAPDRPSDAELH